METKLSWILRKCIFIGCCVFAITLPFDFSLKNIHLYIPLVKNSLMLIIALLVLLWVLVAVVERRIMTKTTPLLIPILAFLLLHLYSSLFVSSRIIWSLKYTVRFFGLGLIFFVVINFIEDTTQLERLIRFLLLGAMLASLFVFIQYFWPYSLLKVQRFFEDSTISPHRIRGLFGWPTNMSTYLGTLLPLLISSLVSKWRQGRSGEKIWYVFLITILLLSLILSRARGWVLGLFFGLTALWVIPLVKKKDFVPLVVIVIISLFLGSFLMLTHNTLLTFIKNDFEISETSRLCLAKRALELFREHPFKGIGTDMFYWDWQPPARTHNIFLEMTVTIGVFGLLALLWFLGSLFRIIGKGICKDSDFKKDSIQIGVLGSLASFLGHNLVDYFWNLHKIIGLFWILAGIGVCAYLVREK